VNIHIALVGDNEGPILSGIQQYGAVDRVYLLHSSKTEQIAKKIKIILEPLGIKKIILKIIDPFSMSNIVEVLTNIAKQESSNNLFINITGGTNLMAGAATATSFFIGAQAYYIKIPNKVSENIPSKSLLVELPVPKIPYHNSLEQTQISILKSIAKKNGRTTNKIITNELKMSPQIISYHIKELQRKKLIVTDTDKNDSRKKVLSLTNAGNLVLNWIKED
jgi:hypothetical protein